MAQYLTITTPIPGEGGGATDTDVIPPPTTRVAGTLSMGNSGSAVLALKQCLTQFCYYVGTVNNYFDIHTQWAIKYFQHLNGRLHELHNQHEAERIWPELRNPMGC